MSIRLALAALVLMVSLVGCAPPGATPGSAPAGSQAPTPTPAQGVPYY